MSWQALRRWGTTTCAVGIVLLAVACGGSGGKGGQIVWIEGTPPPELAGAGAVLITAPIQPDPALPETAAPDEGQPETAADTQTPAPTQPVLVEQPADVASGATMTPNQRLDLQPNELGLIPVLMYHDIRKEEPEVDDGYTRSVADFKADLQALYDLDYYVVPLRDIVANEIAAPPGKHPVALTFDDGTAGHFRYLDQPEGSLTIDPNSAVGVLEEFFTAHPDFGRGGYFAVPPTTCFDWEASGAEPDQTPYCGQKLKWLLDNGYEVGNHTRDHADLLDLDDETFMEKVGEGWIGLQEAHPEARPDILALPFGNYPDSEKRPHQRRLLREGFTYKGIEITIAGALMVGANPAFSPASTEWDPLYIARIRAYDGELGSTEWLQTLSDNPEQLYTSDGDPGTITVPALVSSALGDVNRAGVEADGKIVLEYDPTTGATA